jgi:hypothetical protein
MLMISSYSAGSWSAWAPFVYQDAGNDVDGMKFSTNGDKTCVSAFDAATLEMTINCADADSSYFSNEHVKFRYTM